MHLDHGTPIICRCPSIVSEGKEKLWDMLDMLVVTERKHEIEVNIEKSKVV